MVYARVLPNHFLSISKGGEKLITRLGIFDSGLGGFSVLRRIKERHGDVSCLYLADTARVPYGDKKPEEIQDNIFAVKSMILSSMCFRNLKVNYKLSRRTLT